jgi:hypothetical protein
VAQLASFVFKTGCDSKCALKLIGSWNRKTSVQAEGPRMRSGISEVGGVDS